MGMDQAGIGNQTACENLWFVAHTRPRCEKKLASYCRQEDIAVTLPCVRSVKRYRQKVVKFEKPLFPGYVFFRSAPHHARKVYQSKYVANIMSVFDQDTFEQQIEAILHALQKDCSLIGVFGICPGAEVRIVAGPLAGMNGTVMKLVNKVTVVLKLDFIGKCAAVVVDSGNIEMAETATQSSA
jgi:transcription antitermination factor NusG